jgi:mannose-1-phosphate guanylyltransferase
MPGQGEHRAALRGKAIAWRNAQSYLASGDFFWNAGIFCFSAGAVLREMEAHCPSLLSATRACVAQSRSANGEGFSQLTLDPADLRVGA